jgi:hypothetical protein
MASLNFSEFAHKRFAPYNYMGRMMITRNLREEIVPVQHAPNGTGSVRFVPEGLWKLAGGKDAPAAAAPGKRLIICAPRRGRWNSTRTFRFCIHRSHR